MREIRLYGSEGGGAVCSPYPYHSDRILNGLVGAFGFPQASWIGDSRAQERVESEAEFNAWLA